MTQYLTKPQTAEILNALTSKPTATILDRMSRYNELREIIYRFIKRYIDENGLPPSRREICQGVGVSSTSVVAHHLTKLDQYGRIRLIPDVARGIVIVEDTNNETD